MAQALKEHGFNVFGFDRIVAFINTENLASIKVAKNIGMIFDKTIQRETGEIRDVYVVRK